MTQSRNPSGILPETAKQICVATLNKRISQILKIISPTEKSNIERQNILDDLNYIVENLIDYSDSKPSLKIIPLGSFQTRTYLPDSDIDLVAFLTGLDSLTFLRTIFSFFITFEGKNLENKNLKNKKIKVNFVKIIDSSTIPVLKLKLNDIKIDLSVNIAAGPFTALFFEKVSCFFNAEGNKNLFKESVLLIKTWMQNEAHILGSNNYMLSTTGLQTMILHLFLVFPQISTPFQAFGLFLTYFSKTNLTDGRILSFGQLWTPELFCSSHEPSCFDADTTEFINQLQIFYSETGTHHFEAFKVCHMNIADSLYPASNLARSVSLLNSARIIRALFLGAEQISAVIKGIDSDSVVMQEDAVAMLTAMFITTLTKYHNNKDAINFDFVAPRNILSNAAFAYHFSTDAKKNVDLAYAKSIEVPIFTQDTNGFIGPDLSLNALLNIFI